MQGRGYGHAVLGRTVAVGLAGVGFVCWVSREAGVSECAGLGCKEREGGDENDKTLRETYYFLSSNSGTALLCSALLCSAIQTEAL